jgi:tellurite resistance protein
MEFFIILVLWIGWMVLKSFLSESGGSADKAAMGPVEIRFQDRYVGDESDLLVKSIEIKGLLPVTVKTEVGFVTSLFDETGENYEPVLSLLEDFQEPNTTVFQNSTEIGFVDVDQGFTTWTQIGVIIPGVIQTPYSGDRELAACVRMINLDNRPEISLGFHSDETGILWEDFLYFDHFAEDKGYQEVAEHRDEARALGIQIAMIVAMSDGSLDQTEGVTLKNWISRTIAAFSDERRESLKELYNDTMKDAYQSLQNGNLALSDITERFNEIGDRSTKYEAIELAFDIMAADGVADAEELKTIRNIASALELDYDEIEKMRDLRIVELSSDITDSAKVEDILDIGPDWDDAQVKNHLRAEFQKWSNRLNTLPEGIERDNAQQMLDVIADARKKYG